MRIYRDHIDALLRGTGARTYEEAVGYLEKIQALMRRAKKPEVFAGIARDIRNAHARKRNLIKLLDAKKW